MKRPTIQEILSVCASIGGTDVKRMATPSLHTDRLHKARCMAILAAAEHNYGIDRIASSLNMDIPEARALLSASRRMVKSSRLFAAKCDECRRSLVSFTPAEKTKKSRHTAKPKRDSFWTEEDEKAIAEACLESTRFMQTFGQPREDGVIRKAITNGVGYYPVPRML